MLFRRTWLLVVLLPFVLGAPPGPPGPATVAGPPSRNTFWVDESCEHKYEKELGKGFFRRGLNEALNRVKRTRERMGKMKNDAGKIVDTDLARIFQEVFKIDVHDEIVSHSQDFPSRTLL